LSEREGREEEDRPAVVNSKKGKKKGGERRRRGACPFINLLMNDCLEVRGGKKKERG